MDLEGRQFPNTIRKHRKINGYSQKRLAKKLDVSISLISQWENGNVMPGFINIIKISVMFGVSPFELYHTLYEIIQGRVSGPEHTPEFDG